MTPTDVSSFASAQLDLLTQELQLELAETEEVTSQHSAVALQRAGLALLNLHIASQRTGLGGKDVLELALDPALSTSSELPEHGLRVGDIVSVREQVSGAARRKGLANAGKNGVDGVVVKVFRENVCVALDKEETDHPSGILWIVKLASDVTYKRMNWTMRKLKDMPASEHSSLIRVLFGQATPSPVPTNASALDSEAGEIRWLAEQPLNGSQRDAIKFALCSREIALIHGPPGTGKTHTLVELILQLLSRDQRLLVCGPSNISVDNLVERLSRYKIPMVRLGHPARLLPSVLSHSLDVLTKTSDAAALVQDIRLEMDAKQASIRKTKSGHERRVIYGEMKELRKEYRERERGCVDSLVKGSKVVLATLHGAGGQQLRSLQGQFDTVIIDEASQALEAQCWVALLTAKKAVLAGDHLQLPPTIKSLNNKGDKKKWAGSGTTNQHPTSLETTLFDRLLALHGNSIKRMLTTQYRMHTSIMNFPSATLYDNQLVADPLVASRLLHQLPYQGVQRTDDTIEPLIFYDTQGGEFPEMTGTDGDDQQGEAGEKKKRVRSLLSDSKSNPYEAALCAKHVTSLVTAGVHAEDIAVITPYNAQLSLLASLIKPQYPEIELGSVDGFQGREKEAVVVSLVRSNGEGDVGFLSEKRRLNVAMTRPRRQLVVVGDAETVGKGGAFLKKWMAHLESEADLRYPDVTELQST